MVTLPLMSGTFVPRSLLSGPKPPTEPTFERTQNPNRTTLYLHYTSLCTGDLHAIRKQNSFSAVLSTEGRVVGLCWATLKPKGPTPNQDMVTFATEFLALSAGGKKVCAFFPPTHTLSHTHTLSLTLTHTLSLSRALSHTLSHTGVRRGQAPPCSDAPRCRYLILLGEISFGMVVLIRTP